jgi:branched-chain amino acid transport system ATP-binding protein
VIAPVAAPPVEFLRVTDLHAFYGESHILHGMDFRVNRGELVTLLGRNGSGRTTTLKAILGLTGRRTGSVMLDGRETVGMATHKIVQLGIGYCPEERGVFASLSAEENLTLLPAVGSGGLSLDELYAMFPNLKERRRSPGSRLSGGEQQMLAMARILRVGARLLLLDEITEGLAPVIVQARLADRHYVVEHGRIVDMIEKDQLEASMAKLQGYLGV